jgi:hypothetical protein
LRCGGQASSLSLKLHFTDASDREELVEKAKK